jgi:hypothetical protein
MWLLMVATVTAVAVATLTINVRTGYAEKDDSRTKDTKTPP